MSTLNTSGEPVAPTQDQTVLERVAARGITEVLHFTTHPTGITGVCATGAVLSADRLSTESMLEHILWSNCASRLKDAAWTGYVNMSISRVNQYMLGKSQGWHVNEDLFWVVLAFDPIVLSHPGVTFATTNNTYQGCVQRGGGADGLEALFAPAVEWGYFGSRRHRFEGMPASWTTDPQAEVLYPGQVSLAHLTAIYVQTADQIDEIHSVTRLWPATSKVPVLAKPEVFQ